MVASVLELESVLYRILLNPLNILLYEYASAQNHEVDYES